MEILVDLPRDPDVCGWIDKYVDGKYIQSQWGKAKISISICRGYPKKRPLWSVIVNDPLSEKELFPDPYIADFLRIKDGENSGK